MKALICACLFVVACKGEESKPAPAPQKPSDATPVERARPRPSLPDTPADEATAERRRPRLPEAPDGDARERDDWESLTREERRARMLERRQLREAALDTNKDGILTPEERLKPMMVRLDADGDGKLTVEELANAQRRGRFDNPSAIDTNGDGVISAEELDAAMTERRQRLRARWRGAGGGSAQGVGPAEE